MASITFKKRTSSDKKRTSTIIIDYTDEGKGKVEIPYQWGGDLSLRIGLAYCASCYYGQPESMAEKCKVCRRFSFYREVE